MYFSPGVHLLRKTMRISRDSPYTRSKIISRSSNGSSQSKHRMLALDLAFSIDAAGVSCDAMP